MNVRTFKNTFLKAKPGYTKVDSGLFKGSAPTIRDLVELKKQGVNQIYDFRHDSMRGFKFIEVIACKCLGIKYNRRKFSFFDNKNPMLKDFEEVATSIKENAKKGNKTFIHCNSGHHRTGQMVEFYNLTRGETLENCRKIYPKTFKKRVEIVLRDLVEKDDYFDRKYIDKKPSNPIEKLFVDFNNKVVQKTRRAFDIYKSVLLGDVK